MNQIIKSESARLLKTVQRFFLNGSDDEEWRTNSSTAKAKSAGTRAVTIKFENQLLRILLDKGHLQWRSNFDLWSRCDICVQ